MTQQDYRDLIRGMGGPEAAIEKLDTYFSRLNAQQDEPYAWMGNEPSIGDPFVYLAAGEPWRAQQIIRAVQTTQWFDLPQGLCGNDDLGTMSAWYVWNAIGVYPENPSVRGFAIGSPLFTHVVVRSPSGVTIDVRAPQASDTAPYVQSLRRNGSLTQRTWIALPMRGTLRLDFVMASTPNTQWGTQPSDAPPSYTAAPVAFPPATTAMLQAPSPVAMSSGGSSRISFGISNVQGTAPVRVSWKAQMPSGLHVQPGTGTVTVPAGQTASIDATLTSDAAAPPGYYDARITAQTADGAVLQHATVIARVGRPSSLAYVEDRRNASVLPVDYNTGSAGTPISVGNGPNGEVLTPDGSRLFVLNRDDETVTVVDTVREKALATIKVGKGPDGIAIAPDGGTVWVSENGADLVQPIDVRSFKLGKPITLPDPGALVAAPDGSALYVLQLYPWRSSSDKSAHSHGRNADCNRSRRFAHRPHAGRKNIICNAARCQ